MNCDAFRRWLDDGMPGTAEPAARAHAATCERCARELAAALALSAALSERSTVPAPVGFADHVMRQIAASRTVQRLAPAPRPLLPWWIQAATQPAAAMACVVAALLLWRGDAMIQGGRAVLAWAAAALAPSAANLSGWATMPAPFADPTVQLGVSLALLPLVAIASLQLYRWSERLFAARPMIARGMPISR